MSTLLESASLLPLLGAGRTAWEEVIRDVGRALPDLAPIPISEVSMHLPCRIGDYVDFYSSLSHAQNVGRIFRPNSEPLTPNWRYLPIGYHGRSGTIKVDGTPIPRPHGQRAQGDFGLSQRLDFELEMGFITGDGPGEIPVAEAEDYIFGLVLVNDWSARDIQAWEYQPLGPFLGKSFATTISPWVVPLSELASRRIEAPVQDPPPLPYLTPPGSSIDLDLEVRLNGRVISRSNLRHLYWTMSQQLAHATSNGATLRAGDLFASGTISGPTHDSLGCLLEITEGQGPFLHDGDTVSFTAGDAAFGTCSGTIQPR
ncbi:MAG TPA: fumarylacetoacetate hydrolase family protein [Acidimicrobiia bacterium]|nr:fumarylacetoacetate hydrolase family protein [Acidimicrobiia bacterium]